MSEPVAPALPGYVHGGTDPAEVARLDKQAAFCAGWVFRTFDAPAGARVLDLATGVGAMAWELHRRHPDARLVGVDLAAPQLRVARRHRAFLPLLRADGSKLPFRDGAFERVHCSWLLEHVPEPVPILREVRRVLAPGGVCHFTEVDNGSLRATPDSPEVLDALLALNAAQQRAGGDPYVGQKLERLFHAAGFPRVEVTPVALEGSAEDPVFFQGFIDEFAEIFEGLDEALPEHRLLLAAAAARLRALARLPGASLRYTARIARGYKDRG